jgi:ribosomal protein S17
VEDEQKILERKEDARKPIPAYKPKRSASVGDMIAIFPPKTDQQLFFVGRVVKKSSTKYVVNWFDSKRPDGNWRKQIVSSTKLPYASWIWHEAVLDMLHLPPNAQKSKSKYKIDKAQLKHIMKIASEYKSK